MTEVVDLGIAGLSYFCGGYNEDTNSFVTSTLVDTSVPASKQSTLSYNGSVFWTVPIMSSVENYRPGEVWCEVAIANDFSVLSELSSEEREKVRHWAMWRTGKYIFEELGFSGMFGKIKLDNQEVFNFIDQINNAAMVNTGDVTRNGDPIYEWQLSFLEWKQTSIGSIVRNKFE